MIGRIYKIQHLDSSLCYIGSTCNTIRDRWSGHKKAYKTWFNNKDKYRSVSLYPYLEQYGVDRFKMLLIAEYQVADKLQLFAYEQLAINRTKLCCNQIAPLQLISTHSMSRHYYQANKELINERNKQYRQANKQSISKQKSEYYQANKQAFRDRSKDYYQANKQRSKDYYQTNKNTILQKAATRVMCECGTESRKDSLSAHRKTAKHARLLAALNAPTQ